MERGAFNFYFIHFCPVCFSNHIHVLFSVKITFLNTEQNEKTSLSFRERERGVIKKAERKYK